LRHIFDKPEAKEYVISHKKPWFWVVIMGIITVFFVWNRQWFILLGVGAVFGFFWMVARELKNDPEAN